MRDVFPFLALFLGFLSSVQTSRSEDFFHNLPAVIEALIGAFSISSAEIFCPRDILKQKDFKTLSKELRMTIKLGADNPTREESTHNNNVIVCYDNSSSYSGLTHTFGTKETMVVLVKKLDGSIISQFPSNIGQKIYFADLDKGTIIESYSIGQVERVANIGSFKSTNGSFVVSNIPGFIQRRSNFHGSQLTTLTEMVKGYWNFDDLKIRQREKGWWLSSQGDQLGEVDLEEIHGGLFCEMLGIVQSKLNFTTKIVIRRERKLANFGTKVNGTWNGHVGNVVDGDVDFMAGAMMQRPDRFEVLDFGHPLAFYSRGLFVPRQSLERREWLAFSYPLDANVWICLLATAVALTLIFNLIFKNAIIFSLYCATIGVVQDFWMFGATNFGKSPSLDLSILTQSAAVRTLLFFALFSGNMVFICYKSSLTAELALKRQQLPFTNMDELISSDYFVTYWGRNHEPRPESSRPKEQKSYSNQWFRLYNEKVIYQQGQSAYVTNAWLDNLLESTRPTTMLFRVEGLKTLPSEYLCLITMAFTENQKDYQSFSFPKNSPYYELINYAVLKEIEEGVWDVLKQKYVDVDFQCPDPPRDVPLSFTKLISVFAIFGSGSAAALILLLLEFLTRPHRKPQATLVGDIELSNQMTKAKLATLKYEDELQRFAQTWGAANSKKFLENYDKLMALRKNIYM